jgi:multiple sugar transport system substrate-binding protein
MSQITGGILGALLTFTPLGANAADLVVWWDEGYYAEEGDAIAEIIAAFEQATGNQVELTTFPQEDLPGEIEAALESGTPPDFAFGYNLAEYVASWAFRDRLVDLTDAIGAFSDLFDPGVLDRVTVLNGSVGQKALYGLPVGRTTNHLHVWESLLKRAGFTLADIPREWEAFWAFWCDQVQTAVREATGRDDIWSIGLPMSPAVDTWVQFLQFVAAYDAEYVTPDGVLVIDEPQIRRGLIQAMAAYTAFYRSGCIPPDAVTWDNYGNNASLLAQATIMTANETLSIPNELKGDRPSDYYENLATIEWPVSPRGEPFPIGSTVNPAVVFKEGGHADIAKEFVRFLVADGWLAHYLNFSAERLLPPMPGLLAQPFWLDPSDPHRMASVMQADARPLLHHYATASGDWRHDRVLTEHVWGNAIHRVVTEGISPEQAVDEAIVRIKQILTE